MDFGAHLPLMDFGGNPYTLAHLATYTQTAARLGFRALSVNDHMVFSVPWLDGPTALAAMIEHSGDMTLATTASSNTAVVPCGADEIVQRENPSRSPVMLASRIRASGSRAVCFVVNRSSYGSDDLHTSSYVSSPRGVTVRTWGHHSG